MKEIVIGTAGHIDHGKTSLVQALTGTDTDRLKEEKERGITIDLGFAFWSPDESCHVGIVDVPGHERFVKNMLAGVGGIDLVLFVIAADEGVMPQTREHLAICELLAIQDGIIALTKIDMVDEEWLELVRDDVAQFFAPTFLGGKPIVPVSSKTGEGLEELQAALRHCLTGVEPKRAEGVFRLPIDRVFTMRGFGTVVTGTLASGAVKVEDRVVLYPHMTPTRIRGLQVHNQPVEQAVAGQRTAANLQGLEKEVVERGAVLAHPGELISSLVLNVRFRLIEDAAHPLKHRARVRFHLGTSEVMARLYLFDREVIEPGDDAPVQVRLEAPVAALPRDRFVVRSYSPMFTIGGGIILDVHPSRHKRFRDETIEYFRILETGSDADVVELYVKIAGEAGLNAAALAPRTHLAGKRLIEVIDRLLEDERVHLIDAESRWVVHPEIVGSIEKRFVAELSRFHAAQPLKEGMAREELRSKTRVESDKVFHAVVQGLQARDKIVSAGNLVRQSSHRVQLAEQQETLRQELEQAYTDFGFQPPSIDEVAARFSGRGDDPRSLIQVLIDQKRLVRLKDNLVYHRSQLVRAEGMLRDHLEANGEIAPSEFRDLLAISRKHAIPLLEYFDNTRVTLRVGDKRVLRSA